MSDFRAIAGASRTLRTLLRDRMTPPAPEITIAPPDVQLDGVAARRVNLFLYYVAENPHLKHQEIPGSGHPAAYGNPPLSLNLFYLLTAFSRQETAADADLDAQLLLGDAMRVLHDLALVTDRLRIQSAAAGTVGDPIFDEALLDQFEQLKIRLQPASLDDLTKIWTALPQANFRRSAVYEVTVVQIESRSPRRFPLPVRQRRIHLALSRRPQVNAASRTPVLPADPTGNPHIRLLESLTLEGFNFRAERTWVQFAGLEPIQLEPLTDHRIQIQVPDTNYPADADHPAPRPIPAADRLQPGACLVEVLTRVDSEVVEGGLGPGQTVIDRRVHRSNQAVFMLVPEITGLSPLSGPATALLTVSGKRLFREERKSFVLVGDVAIEVRSPQPGDPWAAPTETSVQVPLSALADGLPPPPLGGQPYPVRFVANGAQSQEAGLNFTLLP